MAKKEIELSEDARLVVSRGEQGPQVVYDGLSTARRVFIATYNLPKAGGPLLHALEGATKIESLRLISNIPNWWPSYWSRSARDKAREAIQSSLRRLTALAERDGVEIYFTRANHSKIYICDDIGYVGSSNFSDESASNVEAGVIIEGAEALEELQAAAWELLRPGVLMHPTLANAVAESLADWLQEELQFDKIYDAVHDVDSAAAQDAFKTAIQQLLELAQRVESILEDVRDERWTAPLQSVVQEVASLDEIGQIVSELEFPRGIIQSCANFSFQAVIEKHITDNCSDEEDLEMWQEFGQSEAEEQWEHVRTAALEKLREVTGNLEELKNGLVEKLRQLGEPIDNT